jgi:transcriptional regulator with AAA-type ATPase domain
MQAADLWLREEPKSLGGLMLETSQVSMDEMLGEALSTAGLVGPRLREELVHELKSKIVLRSGRDPIEIIGARGTGKHMVAEAAHLASQSLLDREGPLITFACDAAQTPGNTELIQALDNAQGGTLLLERFGALREHEKRGLLRRIDTSDSDTLLISLREQGIDTETSRSEDLPAPIKLKPLHQREDDLWALIDHFFASCVEDASQPEFTERCQGFSRQAKADLAQAVAAVGLESVRQLRVVVRDIVFAALALPDIPLKIKSDQVRPYLEERYGQTDALREARDAESIGSRFDELLDRTLLEQLSEIHGIPVNLMQRQAELVSELTSYLDDAPRSYRNILDRAEDIQRAGLWLMTGARTQAEFRRYFGEERYMRPTKSVAWAFYNRVFKRDM